MPGIITDTLKTQLINNLIADMQDSANNFYIAYGRSEDWDSADTAPTPVNSIYEERRLRDGLQSGKLVDDISKVVPRYNWSSGTVYSAFDDRVGGHPTNSYYVLTDDNQVYICLRQGKNSAGQAVASTVKPTGLSNAAFETGDGYSWKFAYSLGSLDAAKYLAANFLPVHYVALTDSDSPLSDQQQEVVQNAAIPGQILGYSVVAGGTGYTSAPTVVVNGDGTSAKGAATIFGGAVSKVEVYDSAGSLTFGQGYTSATVALTGGGGNGAVVRPIFGPDAGIGADPTIDLRATSLMLNIKPAGNEANDFITGNDFRQIALIRNPTKGINDSDYTDITGKMLYGLQMNSISSAFTKDNVIIGSSSSARAYIDSLDSATIWYHQTETTGYTPFVEGESISEENGTGAGVLELAGVDGDSDAFILPEMDPNSGSILYVANRSAVSRSTDQTEDIKIVIRF